MYIFIPINHNRCRKGLQTIECPARDWLATQNLLHISARDPQAELSGRLLYESAKNNYDVAIKKLNQICAKCVHNKSK